MKSTVNCCLLMLIFAVFSPFALADADDSHIYKKDVFIMPTSVEKIEAEAFVGTAVRTIIFHDGLHSIGDLAFADSHNLTDVYIPSSTEYIGRNAFPSNRKVTIHGVIGSLAEKWAKEHQVPFVPSNIGNVVEDGGGTNHSKRISADRVFQATNYERNNHLHGRTENEGKSMRPQERPELNPIDYRFP